jgi:molecular chaperone GrpE
MAEAPPDREMTDLDVSTLERRVAELEQAVAEERQARLRALADFENFRRRTEREAGAARRAGRRDVLLPLLDILDNVERALAAGSTDPTYLRGVEAIREQLRRTLTDLGAEPIPGIGSHFDPRIHEAVGTDPAATQPPDTVVAEVRRGFLLDGEVLRPSQVVVARSVTGGRHGDILKPHGGERKPGGE